MAGQDIVVVGASAGGVEPLTRLVGDLPPDFPGAVFIVLHMSPHSGTALARILARQTKLTVDHPRDGEAIQPEHVYVAVPDRHLLVQRGAVRVTNGPKENGYRPAVDTLFRTAAAAYGPRVVGVVLSGTRDDGTAGLRAIHAAGGRAVVQHPDDAQFPGMPRSALTADHPDWVLPAGEIGVLLSELARDWESGNGGPTPAADDLNRELRWANPDLSLPPPADPPVGIPSGFTCPECHGALWEIEDTTLPRYRCRVGHGFSADSLLHIQRSDVESALWTAYRALEERAAICRRLAERARDRHADITTQHFLADAADVGRQAEALRALLWSKQWAGDRSVEESPGTGEEQGAGGPDREG